MERSASRHIYRHLEQVAAKLSRITNRRFSVSNGREDGAAAERPCRCVEEERGRGPVNGCRNVFWSMVPLAEGPNRLVLLSGRSRVVRTTVSAPPIEPRAGSLCSARPLRLRQGRRRLRLESQGFRRARQRARDPGSGGPSRFLRPGTERLPPEAAQHVHDLPELCSVAAHDGSRENVRLRTTGNLRKVDFGANHGSASSLRSCDTTHLRPLADRLSAEPRLFSGRDRQQRRVSRAGPRARPPHRRARGRCFLDEPLFQSRCQSAAKEDALRGAPPGHDEYRYTHGFYRNARPVGGG